jgi:hypothetical protein
VDLVGPDELPPEVGSEPAVNIFDQPRREEQA